jgi:hypothetical protein
MVGSRVSRHRGTTSKTFASAVQGLGIVLITVFLAWAIVMVFLQALQQGRR